MFACLLVSMMTTPVERRRNDVSCREAWARWPRILEEGVAPVGCRMRMARMRVKTPRDWRTGCGETRRRRGWAKTPDQAMATRTMPPTRASQPVP